MVIEENKQNLRKHFASISKHSVKIGAVVLGSAFAVSSYSAQADIPTVSASEQKLVSFASTNNAFLDAIIPDAYELAHENDLYASVMIAQAILESGWGASGLASAPNYNLFGIKGDYNGESVNVYTLEDDGSGNYYQITAEFRKYPSYRESLTDYVDKMVNGLTWNSEFYSPTWKSNTTSYSDATSYLTGTYATDTRYGTKLNSLITNYNLAQYDTTAGPSTPVEAGIEGDTTDETIVEEGNASTAKKSYTVQAGDGLYTVASKLGITLAELKAQYNLTSNLIFPGQVFSVAVTSDEAAEEIIEDIVEDVTEENADQTATPTKSYTVQAGDGLYSVARALGVSVAEVRAQNGGSDLIFAGDVFTAEGTSEASTPTETTTPTTTPTSTKSYTVKAGDGLYSVARALGVSVAEVRAQNGGSDLIFAGDVFTANGSSTATTTTPAASTSTAKSATSYTVKAGDGLYSVARALGVSVAEVRAQNGGSDLIFAGDVFTVNGSSTATTTTPAASTSTAKSATSYTVKAGDGLYSVARALGISVADVRSQNGGSDLIFAGDVFTANTSSTATTTTPVASTSTAKSGTSYTVKAGDGLYTVARALGISVADVRAQNGGSDAIFVGDIFTTSNATVATSTTATTTTKASSSTAATPASKSSYTVKAGDGLYTVARALGISVADVRAQNGGSDAIFVGDVFTAKTAAVSNSQASSNASSNSSAKATTSASSATKTYTVASGDTLYRIAKNNGLSLDALMKLNDLSNNNLYIGQVLKLK
ncbi:LysM peptidoglycan-binding domain-containing protein [Aerococcus sp. 1KP-2016]|uniref:LysM peptidoglycan-binding domain-containing protein n=1 Tax=Aerococcus sp. 1KP-2016 TaxID=1981982 RepID=UPI000B99C588|nr:LysM peptidoglycan-binding domain-containing protein [Aerococcus sp. 1KP-2016]OYQ68243.1 N-acetylmuramoyl-L-alanine amidase [Aerococcus sp. 1KP-2016]